jgi:hypothetical protein
MAGPPPTPNGRKKLEGIIVTLFRRGFSVWAAHLLLRQPEGEQCGDGGETSGGHHTTVPAGQHLKGRILV